MIGDKKARQIAGDIKQIRELISKTVEDIAESGIVTRLYLRDLISTEDQEIMHKLKNIHKQ